MIRDRGGLDLPSSFCSSIFYFIERMPNRCD